MSDKSIERFLHFEGKSISILLVDGTWWVAVKPICDVLNVDYRNQLERIEKHRILSQRCGKHHTVAADGRLREMFCLPEKNIYGWLFNINSDSPELINYQEKCYDVLYNHFHGALTFRVNLLNNKTDIEIEIEQLKEELDKQHLTSPQYLRIQELINNKKNIVKTLKEQDKDLSKGQMSFFFN